MPSKKQLLYGMVEIFKALGDIRRLQILYMLQGREYSVSHIAKFIPDVTRGAISQHLQVLKRTKLVKRRNEQTKHFYRLDPKPLQIVQHLIYQLNKNDSWPEKAQNQVYQNIKKP
ncbi:MAG: winged helix-turn-helix transcriptional regulator [Oleispira sp.]|nr:winged helix-turn-helix transcriptional regulator [Oleispira sp.]